MPNKSNTCNTLSRFRFFLAPSPYFLFFSHFLSRIFKYPKKVLQVLLLFGHIHVVSVANAFSHTRRRVFAKLLLFLRFFKLRRRGRQNLLDRLLENPTGPCGHARGQAARVGRGALHARSAPREGHRHEARGALLGVCDDGAFRAHARDHTAHPRALARPPCAATPKKTPCSSVPLRPCCTRRPSSTARHVPLLAALRYHATAAALSSGTPSPSSYALPS
jgi:hypothetical protein